VILALVKGGLSHGSFVSEPAFYRYSLARDIPFHHVYLDPVDGTDGEHVSAEKQQGFAHVPAAFILGTEKLISYFIARLIVKPLEVEYLAHIFALVVKNEHSAFIDAPEACPVELFHEFARRREIQVPEPAFCIDIGYKLIYMFDFMGVYRAQYYVFPDYHADPFLFL